MTNAEKIKITKALAVLAVTFGEDVSEERIELYLDALDDLDPGRVLAAIGRLARTVRFFPKPVEIRELVEGSENERADRAWVLFSEACYRSGDCSVFIDDQRLAQAMVDTFFGWIPAYETLVELSPEMVASKRKEFVAAYRRAEKRLRPDVERYHMGRHEASNRETLSNWRDRWIENGRDTFDGVILVVRDRVEIADVRYETSTGFLTTDCNDALVRGETPKLLRARAPRQLPEKPTDASLAKTPEETRADIATYAKSRRIARAKGTTEDERN